jgi:hypothetical protein
MSETTPETVESPAPEETVPSLPVEPPDDHILDPAKLSFTSAPDGSVRLEIADDRCVPHIGVARLFPVTLRRDLLSVTDGGGDEVGVLLFLRALPGPQRRLVLGALRKRYLVPQITAVNSLRVEFGILYCVVETTRGKREFVVRDARDNIREFPGGRLQITDVDGNHFDIINVDTLPGKAAGELYRLL